MSADVRYTHFIGFHPYRMFEPANADKLGYKRPYPPPATPQIALLSALHSEAYTKWQAARKCEDAVAEREMSAQMSALYKQLMAA